MWPETGCSLLASKDLIGRGDAYVEFQQRWDLGWRRGGVLVTGIPNKEDILPIK